MDARFISGLLFRLVKALELLAAGGGLIVILPEFLRLNAAELVKEEFWLSKLDTLSALKFIIEPSLYDCLGYMCPFSFVLSLVKLDKMLLSLILFWLFLFWSFLLTGLCNLTMLLGKLVIILCRLGEFVYIL